MPRGSKSEGLQLRGFHIFSGSQNLSAEAIVEAQTPELSSSARAWRAGFAHGIDWLNIGGGFGVPYFPGEKPLDLGADRGEPRASCASARAREIAAPLVLELGRYLVAEAGVYVCRVLDRKVSQGQTFLVTDGGLHHHLAASGNFGQVIRKNYPVAIGNRIDDAEREVQTVVGPLCTPLDLLADRMALAPAESDDLIVVFQSGAYGADGEPVRRSCRIPPPVEVLV